MIKIGMIGGGVNSAVGAAHVAAMRMTGKFELAAGCFSGHKHTCAESAEKYGVDSYSDLASLLTAVDRAVVLSPTPKHFEHVATCLQAKLPILCEKSLGVTPAEADQLTLNAAHAGTPLSCVFNYAFYPAVQKLRDLVDDGELGDVTHIHVEMPQSVYLTTKPQEWRMTDEAIYLDLGVHLHHLVWFLTEQSPNRVQAVERNWCHDVGVVDYVSAQLSYETFQCHMWFSKCSAGNSNGLRIRVYGSNGSAEWYQREPDLLRVAPTGMPCPVQATIEVPNPRFKVGHPTGYVEALANLYNTWADKPTHPALSPLVACEGLHLMWAMRESARTGKEVML
jgi:predicted dehydrogenase